MASARKRRPTMRRLARSGIRIAAGAGAAACPASVLYLTDHLASAAFCGGFVTPAYVLGGLWLQARRDSAIADIARSHVKVGDESPMKALVAYEAVKAGIIDSADLGDYLTPYRHRR